MDNPSEYQSTILPAVLAASFVFLFLVEFVRPLRKRKRSRGHRLFVNLCLTLLVFVCGTFLVRTAGLGLSRWTSDHSFGALNIIPMPVTAHFLFGFLLMDLTFYYWHRVNHVIPLLWRFHNVHHVDPDLDVTTSFRFHFVEIAYSTVFRVVQVGLIGVLPITYVLYEGVFSLATMFHHSNLRLPIRFERWLNRVVVTPRMHGIHHSTVKEETNSNYSVVFRWWDEIHRSLRVRVLQSGVNIGVPAYQEAEDNRLLHLLKLPFQKQRDHWQYPDGKRPTREQMPVQDGGKFLVE